MSLVGTLAKVAVGAMVAKGVSGAMKGGGGGGGLGGLVGGLLGQAGGAGGLGGLLGGAAKQGGGLGGALGGALGGGGLGGMLGGQQQGGGLGGALGQILGGASGGQQQPGGGLGGLLDSLGGGQQQSGGGLGDLLNSALAGNPQPPTPTAEDQAAVCLRAMLMAARADGQIDAAEQEKILGQLGELDESEKSFIQQEMANPTDFNTFVSSIPAGMEQQVYLMSLLAIDLDAQAEAQYLDKLAKSTNIDQATSNAIHQKLGVPQLYS